MRTQNNSTTSISQNLTLPSKAQNARGGRYHSTLNIGLSQYFKFVLLYLSFIIFFLLNSKSVYADNTFTANSLKTITTSAKDTKRLAEKTEQYKLTVKKGTGVNKVTLTPSSSDGFYNEGTTVTVQSATYNTGYKANSGIGQSYIIDSARTASVTAKKITYAVTYNYNCPSGWTNKGGLPAAQTKTYGTNLTLSSTKPAVPTKATDTGYTSGETGYQYKKTYSATFKEWNTKADGTGTAYASGAKYSANVAVTLYAIWTTSTGKTSEQYYLTVNKDSGVSTATNSQWVNKGSSVNITATAKSGYKITGGTGSTGAINDKKTVNITSTIIPYTLTWSKSLSKYGHNLGTSTSGDAYYAGSKVIVYTNINGVTSYANPYQAGSITIKPGTAVILRMITGNNYGSVQWNIGDTTVNFSESNTWSLISSSYTPITSGTLSKSKDDYFQHDNGSENYLWAVRFS